MNIQGFNPSPRSRSGWKLPKLKEEINSLLEKKFNVPFVGIVESWLKPEIMDTEINILNYNIFRCDRKKSQHGGVLLYVHQNIIINNFFFYDDDECSAVICISKLSKCMISCLYRPPTASPESFSNLLNFYNNFFSMHNTANKLQSYIFGDFNLPKFSWNSHCTPKKLSLKGTAYSLLNSFMDEHLLLQYIKANTRKNNILDLFLTNDPNFVHLVKCVDFNISDHYVVKIFTDCFKSLNTDLDHAGQPEISGLDFSTFNLNHANYDGINNELSQINWESIISNSTVEGFPEVFKQLIFSTLEKHCPSVSTFKNRKSSYWKKRRKISRKIRNYNKKLKSYDTVKNSFVIQQISTKIKNLQDAYKNSFFDEKRLAESLATSKIKTNSKYFFKYANRFRKTLSSPSLLLDKDDVLINDPKSIANKLQDHFRSVFSNPKNNLEMALKIKKPEIKYPISQFSLSKNDIVKAIDEIKMDSAAPHSEIPAKVFKNCKAALSLPLQIFWKKSFISGTVPQCYKAQQIVPIHKKGPKTDPTNYRPVSLTPHEIKIFERSLRNKLVFYFESNNILNQNQHGFRKNFSCMTQLIQHVDTILNHLINDSTEEVDSVYIDYSKAFDKIDHKILIRKLEIYQLSEPYIKWIRNFLSDRKQYVLLNNFKSYETDVISGVPQGSVLGPLLFILFINDLSDNISNSSLLTFADDTKITHPIGCANDSILLQNDLNLVIEWSQNNNMTLNKNKFELMCHRIKKESLTDEILSLKELPFNHVFHEYEVDNDTFISPSGCVKDLGVMINSKLDWEDHIFSLTKFGKRLTSWLLNVFFTRDKEVMLTLFNSIVRSKLEYCSPVWDPYKLKHINSIEQIQRSFTKKIKFMKDLDYWQRIKSLKIMSLQRRREKLTILLVWKIKNHLAPNNINMIFSQNPSIETRSNIETALTPPLPKCRGKIISVYENSFGIKATKLWNKLPSKLTKIESLSLFRSKLDEYLFLLPDQPPVNGYYHANYNSILEYKPAVF